VNIVSFYTDDRYKEIYLRLRASCLRFGHELHGQYFPELETWEKAVAYKPVYILDMYNKLGGPLIWLDADCEIRQQIVAFQAQPQCDLALRKRNLEDKYNNGVMYFGSFKEKLIPLLATWQTLTIGRGIRSRTVDQKPLEQALQKHKNIKVWQLDHTYNFLLVDKLTYPVETAVIVHHKESRTNVKARIWQKLYNAKYRK